MQYTCVFFWSVSENYCEKLISATFKILKAMVNNQLKPASA